MFVRCRHGSGVDLGRAGFCFPAPFVLCWQQALSLRNRFLAAGEEMTAEELVIAAQAGDRAAFAELARRFAGLVYKWAGQPYAAAIREEAAAEGWLALAEAVRAYDLSTGIPFAGYARQQVRYAVWNLSKRERRRWQREIPLSGDGDEETDGTAGLRAILVADAQVDREAEGRILASMLYEGLAALPGRQRLVLAKTLLGDATLSAAAAGLGITPQAAYGLRQRGLAGLRKYFGAV